MKCQRFCIISSKCSVIIFAQIVRSSESAEIIQKHDRHIITNHVFKCVLSRNLISSLIEGSIMVNRFENHRKDHTEITFLYILFCPFNQIVIHNPVQTVILIIKIIIERCADNASLIAYFLDCNLFKQIACHQFSQTS